MEAGQHNLVLLHGFTQTRECWPAWAMAHTRLDLPGHGGRAAVAAGWDEGARLLAGDGGRGVWLGYSLGGRWALQVALAFPDLVTGLVLIGATAGIEDEGERARRVAADEARAQRLEAIGVDGFVDEWLALPMFAGLPPEARFDGARRSNTVAGLASSLRLAGTGSMPPVWDRLAELRIPVLAVAGGDDAAYAALARRLAAGVGGSSQVALVRGAGHAAHLERPEAFRAVLAEWLHADSARPSPSSPP